MNLQSDSEDYRHIQEFCGWNKKRKKEKKLIYLEDNVNNAEIFRQKWKLLLGGEGKCPQ